MRTEPQREMGYRFTDTILAFLIVALGLASTAFAAAPPPASETKARLAKPVSFGTTTYRVVNLSPYNDYGPVAINASGQVAWSHSPDLFRAPLRAFFYDGARVHDIGRLGNDFASINGLNDAGQVVGSSLGAENTYRNFIWSTRRPITDIGLLPGARDAWRPVINNSGVVTGYMGGIGNDAGTHGYRWSSAAGMTDLGTLALPGRFAVYPTAINDAGVITGYASDHAFRWTFGSGMVDIHSLGSHSYPIGIDAKGNIAGNYADFATGDSTYRAFVWTPATGMLALTNGADKVHTGGITANGSVFGLLTNPAGKYRAFTWTRGHGVIDLGTLGGRDASPTGANNRGQVIGQAEDTSNRYRPFVWSAREGMLNLNKRLRRAPAGLEVERALAISDNGSIVVASNSGLLLLKPTNGAPCACPHAVGPLVAPELVGLGAPFDASVTVAGENPAARYNVTWNWGDGTTTRSVIQDAARGKARHSYTTRGVYTITANVVDERGVGVMVSTRIVVDAAQGLAGAGAFMSRHAGDGTAAPRRGRAEFVFMAPSAGEATSASYTSGARAMLHFKVADFDFRSTDIAPVAIARSRARFSGSGSVNGRGNYHFDLVTIAPGGDAQGRFGLRIWHTDPATGAQIIDYDNQQSAEAGSVDAVGSALTEGSIALE